MKTLENAKKQKKNKKKWYIIQTKKFSYYIWSLPLIPIVEFLYHIKMWLYNRRKWDKEKAIKIIDFVLPDIIEWSEKDNAYYYSMEWGTSHLWKKALIWHRPWAKKFAWRLHRFIQEEYEVAGYKKEIINEYSETWVKFSKEEKG